MCFAGPMGKLCFHSPTDAAGTILVPPLCLPQSKDATISRSHAALNLLSCLHTSTTRPPLSLESLGGKKMKTFSVDDFKYIKRFNCKLIDYHPNM